MALSRDEILGAQDLKTEAVPVPEWGGEILIRTMTGTERDLYEQSAVSGRDAEGRMHNVRARLVAFTAVSESGEVLFSDEDIEALGKKSVAPLDRAFQVAARLNGLGAQDIAELAKN